LGRNAVACRAQGFGRGAPCRAFDRGRAPGRFGSTDVGRVAEQVTARPRRPMVCRSAEANSGGNGQSAETARHQEEGKTACENLSGGATGLARAIRILVGCMSASGPNPDINCRNCRTGPGFP